MAIGRNVAKVAQAFGCQVIYYSTSGQHHDSTYREVDYQTLLSESDIISIHAPLNEQTQGLLDYQAMVLMKPSAILINVGRGAIIVEKDLKRALDEGQIKAAGIDVLEEEPMNLDNCLIDIQDSSKLIITPHIAWASKEARQRLMDIILEQIQEFFV